MPESEPVRGPDHGPLPRGSRRGARTAPSGEAAGRDDDLGRLTRGQVVTAWAVGIVAAAATTGVLAGMTNALLYGRGVREGMVTVLWTGVLGILPAVVVGLPTWFGLAHALRRQPRQWVHVGVYGLAGLVLGTVCAAALFSRLLFPGAAVTDLLSLGGPWAVGAALGRLAIVPWVRRGRVAPSDAPPAVRDGDQP